MPPQTRLREVALQILPNRIIRCEIMLESRSRTSAGRWGAIRLLGALEACPKSFHSGTIVDQETGFSKVVSSTAIKTFSLIRGLDFRILLNLQLRDGIQKDEPIRLIQPANDSDCRDKFHA